MRKFPIVFAMVIAMLCTACSCSSLPSEVQSDIAEEVAAELPPSIDPEVLASDITKVLLQGFDKASADGCMTVMEVVDAACDATEAGLKGGGMWDRRISANNQMTVKTSFALGRQTVTMALERSNLAGVKLYDEETPYAEQVAGLASTLSTTIQASFSKGYVTLGDVVKWPLDLASEALTQTGVADRIVGTVSHSTGPTTIGNLYDLGVILVETTLTAVHLWDVILWRTA